MPTILTENPMLVRFDVRSTQENFLLIDENGVGGVYSAASIPDSGVKGNFTATAPDGTVIYNNTSFASPDYVGNVAYVFDGIPIPVNGDGTFVAGEYTIVMRTQIDDGVNPIYVLTFTSKCDFSYTRPTVSINQTIDCISPLFTSTDTTNYDLSGQSSVVVSRDHSIIYPPGSAGEPTPVNGTTITLTTSTFYNGPQTSVIASDITWEFPTSLGSVENFQIVDSIQGVKYVTVDCSFICSISCCLRSLYNTRESYRGVNSVEFQKINAIYVQVMSDVQLALLSIQCGRADEVSAILDRIKVTANCTDDCCGSNTPSLVTGLGGSGVTVEVTSGGSPISVTSNTAGDTTTYTVSLSPTFIALVNESYNTTITSVDNSVTVVSSGTNPKNYDLSVSLPSASTFCSFVVTMTFNRNVPALATSLVISSVVNGGTSTSVPAIAYYSSNLNLQNNFVVSGFNFGSPVMATKVIGTMGLGEGYFNRVCVNTIDASSFTFSIVNDMSGTPIAFTNGNLWSSGFAYPTSTTSEAQIQFLLLK